MGFIPRAHQPDWPSNVPAIERHKETIITTCRNAWEAMKRTQELLGHKTHHRLYQKGQKVWLEGTNLQTTHLTAKLCPKRYGPFKITEIIGSTTYRLELPPQWCIHNAFHANLLLPYQETPEHGQNFKEPPPDLVDGQPEWEVEEILQEWTQHGKKQYLIRWKGYSEAHNSWEPEAYLNTPELLQAFHQCHKKVIHALKAVLIDCAQEAKAKDKTENPVKDQKGNPETAEHQPMRIRSLRMQESKSMTSESLSLPHRSFAHPFASRPSELEGNTLTPPSPAMSLNHSQMPSGIITPAPMLR